MPTRWKMLAAAGNRAIGLCVAICLAGCGERVASNVPAASSSPGIEAPVVSRSVDSPASAASTAARTVATLRGRVRDDLPELTILALAERDASSKSANSDVASVGAIEIRGSDGLLRQRIEGLHTRTVSTSELNGLELVDLNFDGYADLRMMEAPSAGPNTSYMNWLFDPVSERFVPIPALDQLPGLKVVASARELRSEWRDGPSMYGTDVYVFRDGKLVPIRRERRTYSRPGAFTLEISRPDGTGWRVLQKRPGRD